MGLFMTTDGSPFPSIRLLGMDLAQVRTAQVVDHVFGRLAQGSGGWLVTANLDFLRRHTLDATSRALYDRADLAVADGMPLVWAARLQGTRLPERVAGSSLVPILAERAAADGRSLYLLGGEPASNARAAEVLLTRWPRLKIAGRASPRVSADPTPDEVAAIAEPLRQARPDLLLVGLGSPKQERLIDALRPHLPATWMVGIGISFSFLAGHVRRAPIWMQSAGLEWIHRLWQEPERLARRYLVEDLPFAGRLFSIAARERWRRTTGRPS
jgi:N-acetylglucosaminyldiphosphoundecaprenol N-acetyl-beta-D-mannosaminyltransferase